MVVQSRERGGEGEGRLEWEREQMSSETASERASCGRSPLTLTHIFKFININWRISPTCIHSTSHPLISGSKYP